jgi:signal transduction histidine kinase/CheY-like chemotaxis protein
MNPPGGIQGWRSAPLAMFAMALLILVGGVVVIAQNERTYDAGRIEQTQGLADVLAASTAAAVDFDDPGAAQQAVNAFRVNNQIRLIAVYGRDGRRFADYVRGARAAAPTIAAMRPPAPSVVRVRSLILQSGQHIGTVVLEIDREPTSRRISRYLLLAGLFVLAALVVFSLGLAQSQLRRANRELANRAEALAQANVLLEEQIAERAKAEDQLRQSQKMQALGQLTGGIAHDFNNQLTVIQGSADMLTAPEIADAKRIRFAQAIVQASTNAASLTSQLLAFARRQPLKPERIDLNKLIGEMDDLIDRTMGERVKVVTEFESVPCRVEVDRAQLQSAILNIASNARDAIRARVPGEGGGTLTIRTCTLTEEEGKRMVGVEIEDDGSGMDAETLDRIFEPFFTTKSIGQGTGLGLSQVYGFAAQSGGDVRVNSEVGRGTTMTLLLPCVDAGAAPMAEVPAEASEQPSATILVVEDNEDVGAFAETLLSELGHRITRASTGEEALEIARRKSFDIVLSDVVMPGMGGVKLAEILAREQPDLPVVLATGYSQGIVEGGSGGRPVILKPYRLATLSGALTRALDERRKRG